MKAGRATPATIDDYIAGFPPAIQAILRRIKATVQKSAPQATEKISYRMPSFTLNGALVYFAAFKAHIGFYPPVTGDAKLMKELSIYAGEKGNLRFPYDKPIPYALITRIVKARVKANRDRVRSKSRKRK